MIPFHFPILTKLEFAEVRIASNNSTLFCIISIPTADIGSCSKLLVKPIKNGNFTNKLHYQNILNCNKIIYGNDKLCKSYNSLTICNENNLYDISNDTCIANLLRSQLSNCTLIDNRLVSAVEETQFNGTIYVNKESHTLSGTYVVQFNNESIEIYKRTY